ncbi:MAG TPA: DNA replication and repair protein RecF [Thermoanaerobaculia bacterium]|nr:DNA replication and repair protein RecF [Thermoanaerobaculia bacterium]
MILKSIAPRDFRNLEAAEIEFHPSTNLIVGQNGQGKTNLLEAIYFLATTKSFRTNHLSSLLRFDAAGLFASGVVERKAMEKILSVGLELVPARKRETLVNRQRATLAVYLDELHVVAYSAARLEILRGAPEERRRFLDRGISGVDAAHVARLGEYARLLKQRNALLDEARVKGRISSALDAWDAEFLAAGRSVVDRRVEYASLLARSFDDLARRHSYRVHDLSIRYVPSPAFEPGIDIDQAIRLLKGERRAEVRSGFSLQGPHRDRVEFSVHGYDAAEVLSSGELKMCVLLLKLAKLDLHQQRIGEAAVLLLDDLDAELDLSVLQRFLGAVAGSTQMFITSAKQSIFDSLKLGPSGIFEVVTGSVRSGGGQPAEAVLGSRT